jgi:hypothetical protein
VQALDAKTATELHERDVESKSIKAALGALASHAALSGAWSFNDQRVGVFQQGDVAILINEKGELAVGEIQDSRLRIVSTTGGWAIGQAATVQTDKVTFDEPGRIWIKGK